MLCRPGKQSSVQAGSASVSMLFRPRLLALGHLVSYQAGRGPSSAYRNPTTGVASADATKCHNHHQQRFHTLRRRHPLLA